QPCDVAAVVDSVDAEVVRRREAAGEESAPDVGGEFRGAFGVVAGQGVGAGDDVEAPVAFAGAVGMQADDDVGGGGVLLLRAEVDAVGDAGVVLAGQLDGGAESLELILDFHGHQPVEGVLGPAVVGGGAGYLAGLRAAAAVGDLRVVGGHHRGVPRVEVDGAAGEVAVDGCRRRFGRRRRGGRGGAPLARRPPRGAGRVAALRGGGACRRAHL